MTFPLYLHVGPFALHPHVIFETLAYSLAFVWYRRARARHGDVVDDRTRWWVIGAAALGGLIGSRVLSLLEDPIHLSVRWQDPAELLGGKTIVGGLIGGLIAVEWVKRRLGVVAPTGDLLALPLVAGIAIGRVGCFLSGLDDGSHGVETRLPWGVDFGDGVSRHPTQLYEIVFLGALGALIARSRGPLIAVGDGFKLFMVGYLAFRLCVDFIKPVPRTGGLSSIQWACLAVMAYYAPHMKRLLSEAGRG